MSGGPVVAPVSAGLVGKLPAHGDFVRRGDADRALWLDRWLANELSRLDGDGLAERLARLADWHFAMPSDHGLTLGAMIASGDSVGRIYPLIGFARFDEVASEVAARAWCSAAAKALIAARDAGEGADATVAMLAAIPIAGRDAPDGSSMAASWWRADGEVIDGGLLPTGAAFARLLAPDATVDRDEVPA